MLKIGLPNTKVKWWKCSRYRQVHLVWYWLLAVHGYISAWELRPHSCSASLQHDHLAVAPQGAANDKTSSGLESLCKRPQEKKKKQKGKEASLWGGALKEADPESGSLIRRTFQMTLPGESNSWRKLWSRTERKERDGGTVCQALGGWWLYTTRRSLEEEKARGCSKRWGEESGMTWWTLMRWRGGRQPETRKPKALLCRRSPHLLHPHSASSQTLTLTTCWFEVCPLHFSNFICLYSLIIHHD